MAAVGAKHRSTDTSGLSWGRTWQRCVIAVVLHDHAKEEKGAVAHTLKEHGHQTYPSVLAERGQLEGNIQEGKMMP